MQQARAHEAPSGWHYPSSCCSEGDCHPVSCGAIKEIEGGVEFLGLKFVNDQIKKSEDGFCHVCVGVYGPEMGQRTPHCVFMTPRT
jgi:hypothetical protein